MAFAAFADAPVDVAVIEVGLGGRWDATNVINAPVAVVMPISLDHVGILGDTIEEIAAEKAGLIHPGATVISAPQPERGRSGHRRPGARGRRDRSSREGIDFGVRSRTIAIGGQLLELQGLGGSLRRGLPAALRRAPGQQRRLRARGSRGVPRAQPTVEPLDIDVVRAAFAGVQLARPAGGGAAQPDGPDRRGAQPGRSSSARRCARGRVRVRPAGRASSRCSTTRTRSASARGARAGGRRGRRHDEQLAARDAGG